MKKRNLLLTLLLALCLPWVANAQETLTVCNGTSTSSYAPIKGSGGSQTEFIYPASLLADMDGGTITSVKFFSSSTSTTNYSNTVTVFVEEVASSTISSSAWQYNQATATKVYEGTTLSVTGGELVITFSTPYEYNGGNLCFNIWSASDTPTVSYYYLATSNSCAYDYYITPPVSIPFSTGSYLPKAEFTYTAVATCCPKPKNLACTGYTANTATFTWTNGGEETQWQMEYGTASDFSGATTKTINQSDLVNGAYTLTGLTAEQTYYARLKAYCAICTPNYSDPSNTCEFKPSAEIDLTVNDESTTNSYIPIYGTYVDWGNRSQFIIPATALTDMAGGTINKITLYATQATTTFTNDVFSVYMKEVSNTTFTTNAFVDWTEMSTVYNGSVAIANNKMEITFSDPFDYNGGNLLIGFQQTAYNSTVSCTWKGTAQSGPTALYQTANSSHTWSGTVTSQSFLPKTTFTYILTATPKPRNLVVSNLTSEEATISWEAPATATPTRYEYNYKYSTTPTYGGTWATASGMSASLNNLESNTPYDFAVRAVYAEGTSDPAEISFTTEATCLPVTNITVSDITSTGAKLAWTPGGTETSWQYLTLAHGATPDWTSERVITSNTHANVPANIYASTGEQSLPNTEYDFYVRANCGSGDYSEAAMLTFRTACGAITTFPWDEDFDSYSASTSNTNTPTSYPNDVLPGCWTFLNRSDNSNSYPQVFLSSYSSYAVSGNCLFFKSSSNTPLYAVLPEFGTDIAGLELSFTYRNEGTGAYNGTLYVGYMTDPNDASTFNTENAVACAQTTSKTPMNVVLPNAPAGSYFAFKYQGGSSDNYYLAIDNITVKEAVFVTANQIVNTVSDHATEMTWNEFVNHWNNGDHFTSTTFTLMDDITVSTMVGTSDKPFTGTFDGNSHTITVNLTATDANFTAPFRIIKNATIQNLKVDGTINDGGFKFCAGFAGDCYGNNIFTNCESAVTINATTEGDGTHGGFIARNYGSTSSSNLCTTVFNGCAFTGQLLGANTNQSAGFCGWSEYSSPNFARTIFNNCLFAPQKVTMSTANCATFARRRNASYVNFNNCYFLQDFNDGTNNTAQGKQAYTITGVDPVSVLFSGEHILYNMSGIDAYTEGMEHGYTKLAGEGDVVTLTLDGAPGYEANHGTLVANGETYTLTMEAYDTEISGVDCPVPYNVAVPAANLTARSAQVTWTGNSDSYTIMYGEVVDVVTTYDFEDQTIPAIFTNSETHAWTVTSNDKHAGTYSIKSGGAGTAYATSDLTLTLTLTDNTPISFWYKASSESGYDYGRFFIDGSQKLQTSGTTNNWTQYTGELTAGTHTLIWRYYKDSGTDSGDDCFYVDDITFTSTAVETWTTLPNIAASPYTIENLTPEATYQLKVSGICAGVETDYSDIIEFTTLATCPAPTTLAVTTGSVTAHEATLSWTENGEATAWQICLNGDEANLIDADSNPFTLENLTAATTFTAKVRTYCSADDQSDWSNEISFATECDVVVVDATHPLFENFDGITSGIPLCWDNSEGTTTDESHKWNYYATGHKDHCVRFNSYGNSENNTNFLKTPVMDLPREGGNLQLSFWYKNPTGGDFSVFISTDGGDTYTTALASDLTDQSDWTNEVISLSEYAGNENVVIVFAGTSNWGYGDAYIYLDEVFVGMPFTKTIAAVGNDNWANGKGGYYFIASPLAEDVTPNAANGFIVGDYDLYYFSQTGDGEGNEWINFKDETLGGYTLTNGKGYLYASKEGTTLTFTGTPGTNGTVTLDTYEATARFKGWNLVGNPFAQTAYLDRAFYTMDGDEALVSKDANTPINAMQGVMITAEADETTVTFTTEAPATNNSKLNMNLRSNNKQLDNAILVFGGDQQLGKMTFRANSSKIFMPVEGKDYAITSVEGQVGEVPVSFVPEKNGTYSLSFTSEEVSFSYLHLIDNMTGADVNLLQTPSYTFDARTSDYESRFRLMFATGSSATDDTFGFVNASGNFCIFGIEGEATVQVIDVLGHVLSSEQFSGSYEKQLNVAPGVYMIRLIQGNDIRVQKMVVR